MDYKYAISIVTKWLKMSNIRISYLFTTRKLLQDATVSTTDFTKQFSQPPNGNENLSADIMFYQLNLTDYISEEVRHHWNFLVNM